jgi:hypothetical protein
MEPKTLSAYLLNAEKVSQVTITTSVRKKHLVLKSTTMVSQYRLLISSSIYQLLVDSSWQIKI